MLRTQFESDPYEFFYIADSAAFTKDFLEKSKRLGVHVITRMPNNIPEAKSTISETLKALHVLPTVEITNASEPSVYKIFDSKCQYQSIP